MPDVPSTPALSRSGVDRAALLRQDPGWLEAAAERPDARVLVVQGNEVAVSATGDGVALTLVAPTEAPTGPWWLLGVEDGDVPIWGVPAPEGYVPPAGDRMMGLWEAGPLLSDRDAGLFVHVVALARWHEVTRFCSRCGGALKDDRAGHLKRCDRDASMHFPRVEPAVIMLVTDGADRCVLARQAVWPPRRRSVLAGFVEPGESAEQAVVRETQEEVGLDVTDVRYLSSQPWPFPSSLMLGYTARITPGGSQELQLRDGELEDARWGTRAEVREALTSRDPNGPLLLPPPVSIAYRMLADWSGGD